MKKFNLKKPLSLILSVLLGFNFLAVNLDNVYAATKESSETYINPIYEDIDVNSSISNEASESYTNIRTLTTLSTTKSFQTIQDAKDYMRQQLVKRPDVINFEVNTSYYDGIANDIFKLAIEDKKEYSSDEGDYLLAHYASYNCSMNYTYNKVTFTYTMKYLTNYEQEQLVNAEVKKILDQLNVYNADQYTKIKAVHDYIVKSVKYDYGLANYSAYNAIIDKNVVCQGFASLTYKMLKDLGIEVRYITGIGNNVRHGWNIVRIGGLWYNVDNTWDENTTFNNKVSYKYFLKSNADFGDHTRDIAYNTVSFNESYPMAKTSYVYNPLNESPVITASDITLNVGEKFDIMKDVTASDKEDGDIKSNIIIEENTVDTSKVGIYKVVYKVSDSDGNTITNEIKVSVIEEIVNYIILTDISNHWAKDRIELFVSKGYVGGYADKTFRPNNSITRAEFVTIFNKAFGLTTSSGRVFVDTTNHWAKTQIDIAVTNGVCNGKSATEFKPNDPITREEASVMIANYKKLADTNYDKLNKYNDSNQVSSWAKNSVEGMIENGYMSGYSDGTFRPKGKITRAEAVVTLSRVR